jgi:hypothetical protein
MVEQGGDCLLVRLGGSGGSRPGIEASEDGGVAKFFVVGSDENYSMGVLRFDIGEKVID